MVHAAFGAALALLVATAASARPTYAAYTGKDALVQGRGTATVQSTAGGIEWWRAGEPGRAYRRIGTIRDVRAVTEQPAEAIGADEIARLVLAKGGNAVILIAQKKSQIAPPATFNTVGGQLYGPSVYYGVPQDAVDTTLAVIRYAAP